MDDDIVNQVKDQNPLKCACVSVACVLMVLVGGHEGFRTIEIYM